tara:strand:+ start:3901 stop:4860 length:960 start_codon:yes stop_codon:yes gene_type:complete
MAKPTTRETLLDYCLRNLGHPVIEINVDDDQLDDRADEALQFYQEYHSDAVYKDYIKHKITNSLMALSGSPSGFTEGETITGGTSGAKATIKEFTSPNIRYNTLEETNIPFAANETITGGSSGSTATISAITKGDTENGYIAIPDAVTTVQQIFPLDDEDSSINMFDAKYQIHLNDVFNMRAGHGIANYYQTQQHLATMHMVFNGADTVRFNRHMNRLYIDADWENDLKKDSYVIVECFRLVDPATYTDVYNDMFLKRYLTALIKKQWGSNLSKFEGMQLPGGVTLNGNRIMEEATTEIKEIEEEMQLKYEMPPNFMVG